MAPATKSALMLYPTPSVSTATGDITGKYPSVIRPSKIIGLTSSTCPTNPISTGLPSTTGLNFLARIKPPSAADSPTALTSLPIK